jgi:hypothetical protein
MSSSAQHRWCHGVAREHADERVIRAFAGRLRKWANPTRFALFRFVR